MPNQKPNPAPVSDEETTKRLLNAIINDLPVVDEDITEKMEEDAIKEILARDARLLSKAASRPEVRKQVLFSTTEDERATCGLFRVEDDMGGIVRAMKMLGYVKEDEFCEMLTEGLAKWLFKDRLVLNTWDGVSPQRRKEYMNKARAALKTSLAQAREKVKP